MKSCYLCGRATNLTQEHIWSHSVIQAFPSAVLTLDARLGKVYSGEPTIGDVCDECNKGLSKCDAYMASIARQHLVRHQLERLIVLDLEKLSRWVLKTSANHSRVTKEKKEWWRDHREFIKSGGCLPADIDFFGAPWHDPRPVALQELLPVLTLGAMPVLLEKVKSPSTEQILPFISGKWALKVGNAVFMFISYESTPPRSERSHLCDSIRQFGWSLLGIDPFPKSSPFNEYTCVMYSIICDPAERFN